MGYLWLAAIIVFLLLEAATYQYICIWFAGGALGALIAEMLGAALTIQIVVFICVAAVLLVLTRPLVKKLMKNRNVKTNVESVPGKQAMVIEKIDNASETGKVKIGGMEWTARSADNIIIEKCVIVEVTEVSGVKVLVKQIN